MVSVGLGVVPFVVTVELGALERNYIHIQQEIKLCVYLS